MNFDAINKGTATWLANKLSILEEFSESESDSGKVFFSKTFLLSLKIKDGLPQIMLFVRGDLQNRQEICLFDVWLYMYETNVIEKDQLKQLSQLIARSHFYTKIEGLLEEQEERVLLSCFDGMFF